MPHRRLSTCHPRGGWVHSEASVPALRSLLCSLMHPSDRNPPTHLQIVHSLGGSPGTDIAWFLGPPESTTQTAFWSVQPFCRVQTDTQTDHATLATYEARGRIFHPCMRPKKAIVDVVHTPLPWKKIWGAYGAIYTCMVAWTRAVAEIQRCLDWSAPRGLLTTN